MMFKWYGLILFRRHLYEKHPEISLLSKDLRIESSLNGSENRLLLELFCLDWRKVWNALIGEMKYDKSMEALKLKLESLNLFFINV